ncbi:MAG: HAD hydrolase-like protein [Acidobacteriia bacterium]|nr:HAD hydrolase-like protein [Terriglobia bacterium]
MIECLHPGASAEHARVVLFDFDGTISLIRTGWEEVMVPMMVEILAERKTGESEMALQALVEEYVARLTGEQTIYQMIELARQVELRGGKPLDPLAYKKMYHDRLMEKIRNRREELRQGRVSPEHYLVPGARALLEALKERGLKLYCASGTDETYTLEEARLLDVARYFDGGIYGAQDDFKSFSKEILIQRMISSLECRGDQLLGFGDGYVEIKNVKDAGGVAVGVATNEPECQAVNPWKRRRLVSVGADFIIPNFSCGAQLLQTLFPESRGT